MDKCEFEYLGPYKIQAVLGRGGMGAVYQGVHTKSGDAVAIKVIASSVASDMRFRRRFSAEIETLLRLRHPNIVQLIGVGEEQGLLFYAMELVDGHSLHDHIRRFKRMNWMEVIQVGIDVTAALKHAHDMGIIHRDLKPANLMIGNDGRVKLTDFGIAKLFGATDMTAAGSVIGTADYMPPEQAEGKGVTVRSDIYSLGSVMYALLAGSPPFAGKSIPEVLYAVRYLPAPDSKPHAPEAPPDLHLLISEMLEKDPLKRPPTALVIGNRLKAIQQGIAKLEADRVGRAEQPAPSVLGAPVSKELTSIDLTDEQDEDLRATGHVSTQDRPTAIASDSMLKRLAGEFAEGTEAGNVGRDTGLSMVLPPTIDSQDLPLPSTETPLPANSSHYTPISDVDTRRYASQLYRDPAEHASRLTQYLSIAGLVVVLLGLLGGAWYMLQPRSADALHQAIIVAVESGDDSQLSEAIPDMEEFAERFPDDSRLSEITQWLDEAELLRASKLVRRRGRSGAEQLSAIEQGFLDCVQAMNRDPQEARRKFDAFLTVYRGASDLSVHDKRYVKLAEHALEKLIHVRTAPTTAASQQLESVISAAEATMPRAQLANFYRSIVELYGDKPWAKDLVSRIKATQ